MQKKLERKFLFRESLTPDRSALETLADELFIACADLEKERTAEKLEYARDVRESLRDAIGRNVPHFQRGMRNPRRKKRPRHADYERWIFCYLTAVCVETLFQLTESRAFDKWKNGPVPKPDQEAVEKYLTFCQTAPDYGRVESKAQRLFEQNGIAGVLAAYQAVRSSFTEKKEIT